MGFQPTTHLDALPTELYTCTKAAELVAKSNRGYTYTCTCTRQCNQHDKQVNLVLKERPGIETTKDN